MRSKLAFSVLVVASMFGATAVASAETAMSKARDSNAESNAMASMRHHKMHRHHHHHMTMGSSDMAKSRPGGMPVSRKAPD